MSILGTLDGFFDEELHGWAYDPGRPSEPIEVELLIDGISSLRARADLPRDDLRAAGIGAHAFRVPLGRLTADGGQLVTVKATAGGVELKGSPWTAPDPSSPQARIETFRLDPRNAKNSLRHLDGRSIKYLVVDINDLCNAECVYCPHHRSSEQVSLEDFRTLMNERIASVYRFQFGCAQEPTADKRLASFFRVLPTARCAPKKVQLITNGTLLDRHDPSAFREARLELLMLSIDTVDVALNQKLRRGTDLNRILRNVEWFRKECPDTHLSLSIVVSKPTVDGIAKLVELGKSWDVLEYHFREVTNNLSAGEAARQPDFFQWMDELRLPPGRMAQLEEELRDMGIDGRYHIAASESVATFTANLKKSVKRAGVATAEIY